MLNKLRKHIEEIVPLSDEEFDFIATHFQTKKFRKNQYLVQEGELTTKDFWVVEGLLKAYYLDENGKEHILQFAMENWWITDYNAYFRKLEAKFNVECIEATEVFFITLENREQLCAHSHKMANFYRIKSSNGYIALQDRILTLLKFTSKERYDHLFNKYPELFQRVPKTQIAAYLGVSRETLSRMK